MKAEIISIGTELLLGHIVNTNAAFLSQKLAEAGIDVYHQATVGDNVERLTRAIKESLKRSDMVIMSGGLGPTIDDVTVEAISKLTGRPLVLNKMVLNGIKDYFKFRKLRYVKASLRQAYMPKGLKLIRNRVGTAPGLIAEYNGKEIICLPGPPRELEPMFTADIIPYIKKRIKNAHPIRSRSIKIACAAESQIDASVRDLLRLKPPTTVGIYASPGMVQLKIMTKAKNDRLAKMAINKIERKIRSRLKEQIFGCDDQTLEGATGMILLKKKMTIATAESCTGGLIANRLTNVRGSSGYYKMGAITYSNASKTATLGVPEEMIDKYGAVSGQVALEMAKGIRKLAGSDIGLSTTGIAGPLGGTKKKPVGLVFTALVTGKRSLVREFRFRGSREEIKFQTSQAALNIIRENI
ncbi:MAG: competence/damage-inducible protein A [Candidatus Omnitrophota bacterium]